MSPANITRDIGPESTIITSTPESALNKEAPHPAMRGFLFAEMGATRYSREMSSSRWKTSSFGNWL
jgi:hypothetical protein